MGQRPPLDPVVDYTVMSSTAARHQLSSEFGTPRHISAWMTLEQLQSALADRMPVQLGALIVVVSDRSLQRITTRLDAALRSLIDGPLDAGAPIMSRNHAEQALRERVDDLPDGEPTVALEDAMAGLRGVRPHILEDADFATYRAEAHAALADEASGRPEAGAAA